MPLWNQFLQKGPVCPLNFHSYLAFASRSFPLFLLSLFLFQCGCMQLKTIKLIHNIITYETFTLAELVFHLSFV